MSKPRIAIPLPTSSDPAYNQRSWPQYAQAVERQGAEAVQIPLSATPAEIAQLANSCQAVLLPGSPADVNPQKYGHDTDPATAAADLQRENADELLLQDAHNLHKPILGICYGAQSLNVWRSGTLIQDLTVLPVNHAAGASVAVAHTATVDATSLFASLVPPGEIQDGRLPINSSHHQAIGIPGDGLRVVARCPQDGVVEAVEGGQTPEHFVLGVQWHPERSVEISGASRALFARFVEEAAAWQPRAIRTSVA
jgi:putative glutamine amidotransferase